MSIRWSHGVGHRGHGFYESSQFRAGSPAPAVGKVEYKRGTDADLLTELLADFLQVSDLVAEASSGGADCVAVRVALRPRGRVVIGGSSRGRSDTCARRSRGDVSEDVSVLITESLGVLVCEGWSVTARGTVARTRALVPVPG